MKTTTLFLSGVVLAASVSPVFAAGSVISTGTGVPPLSLGGYSLTAFDPDARADGDFVSDVASPLGGDLIFSSALQLLEVPTSWATWSHGFSGDVYAVDYALPGPYLVTLSLPADTGAFLFYAQPGSFGLLDVTATLDDGTTLTQSIDGDAGASGFGFWASPGASLLSIEVASDFDYALGEFSIARSGVVPEAGNFFAGLAALIAVGVPVSRRLRR